jgi:hypothetical protein
MKAIGFYNHVLIFSVGIYTNNTNQYIMTEASIDAKLDLILQKLDNITMAVNSKPAERPKKKESKPISDEKRAKLSRVMNEAKRLAEKEGMDKPEAMKQAWIKEKAGELPFQEEISSEYIDKVREK